jgi:hypothetical protein
MDGHLHADEDADAEGDPNDREKGPHLIEAEVSEGDVLKKEKKSHKEKSLPAPACR